MRRIHWSIVVWTILWIVVVWVLDPAQTVRHTPPSWVLFELWALGAVVLGALATRLLTVAPSGRVSLHRQPVRTIPAAALLWTTLWMVLLLAWALDPAPSEPGNGPGPISVTALKPPEPLLYAAWLAGLAVLGLIRLVAGVRGARHHRSSAGEPAVRG